VEKVLGSIPSFSIIDHPWVVELLFHIDYVDILYIGWL
jgi:hypothetical protein